MVKREDVLTGRNAGLVVKGVDIGLVVNRNWEEGSSDACGESETANEELSERQHGFVV